MRKAISLFVWTVVVFGVSFLATDILFGVILGVVWGFGSAAIILVVE